MLFLYLSFSEYNLSVLCMYCHIYLQLFFYLYTFNDELRETVIQMQALTISTNFDPLMCLAKEIEILKIL